MCENVIQMIILGLIKYPQVRLSDGFEVVRSGAEMRKLSIIVVEASLIYGDY